MNLWKRLLRTEKGASKSVPHRKAQMGAQYDKLELLQIGHATDMGNTREANEDAFLTLKSIVSTEPQLFPMGVFIVADGMGGHAKGKEASSLATRVAGRVIIRDILLPLLANPDPDVAKRPIHEILTQATASANQAVSEMESDAGTTLTSVLVLGRSAYVAHVGDTRAYYLDHTGLHKITKDHSLVSRLVELGQISAEEAQRHPQRNFLYRAVGQGHELKVDTYFQPLAENSHLILCTDGLWNAVSQGSIVDVVESSSCPQEACNRLVDLANDHAGNDNITVVMARINYS